MMTRRVTVFMPVYNAERFLREAIDSILNQSYTDFIFLIIDDGSTDNSRSIIQSYTDSRIKLYCNEKNKGVAYTRNRGLELCETEFIAFMDADDIAPIERLERELSYLDANPLVAGVGGYAQSIDENGNIIQGLYPTKLDPEYIKANMIFENSIANGSVMLRTEIIKKHNIRYLDNYFVISDYRFFCEFLLYGEIANLNEIMQKYRIVSTSLTGETRKNKKHLRNQILDEIHEFNFDMYGFVFTEEQKRILLKAFKDDGKTDTEEELICLYNAFKSMIKQAEEKGLTNAKMIGTVCRKQFGSQVMKAFWLWCD